MDAKRAAVYSGKYFVITTLFAVVGLGFVAAGAFLSRSALETETTSALVSALVPGIALGVVGLAIYRFGKAWALYKTLTAAHEDALADTFDTQRVKSDIVSVVDDRLSDMQTTLQSVNREMRKLRDDEPFDFSESTGEAATGSSTGDAASGSDTDATTTTSDADAPTSRSDTGTETTSRDPDGTHESAESADRDR